MKRSQRQPATPATTSYQRNTIPRSSNQAVLQDALRKYAVVVASGPAGTGKTHLSVCAALEALEAGRVDRIVLVRPAVEAGEQLGFLPGDMAEKMAPYLRPLLDILWERIGRKRTDELMANSTIEISPLAYMRGRTFNRCFVVVDEAQNCTAVQLKLALTRLGHGSTMVLTGDPHQTDLVPGQSGLAHVTEQLGQIDEIGIVFLESHDIVRHELVSRMLEVL